MINALTAARRAATAAGALASVMALAACSDITGPEPPDTIRLDDTSTGVITRMRGVGAIGNGAVLPDGGTRRQAFEFDVDADLDGYIDYVDYSVLRADGSPGELHAGPAVPGTVIAVFAQLSSTCVEFGGIGRLDTDELVEFSVRACDNGTPGVGLDVFGISLPQRPYFRGPDALSEGEIEQSTVGDASVVISRMEGVGAIGDGSATADGGVDRQEFDLDVSATLAEARLDYTDHAAIQADGRPAHLVAGPAHEGTAITEFLQTSDACVELEGVGRLVNTGELMGFEVRACDSGDPGTYLDVFGLRVPAEDYAKGSDTLKEGDLVATTSIL